MAWFFKLLHTLIDDAMYIFGGFANKQNLLFVAGIPQSGFDFGAIW
jgi:hypothetical protein